MSGPMRTLDLTDMRDMPMSAGWYWYLGYLRSTLFRVRHQHASAMKPCAHRPARDLEQDQVAVRLADAAIESIWRYQCTMEAAGVLSAKEGQRA